MRIINILAAFSFLITYNLYAKRDYKDSIINNVNKMEYSKQKKLLFAMIKESLKNEPEKVNILVDILAPLAENAKDERALADAYSNNGMANIKTGNFSNAKSFILKALSIYSELKNDTGIARQYGNLGVIFDYTGDFKNAIYYYQKAIAVFEKIDDLRSMAFAENNIGIIYEQMKIFEKALEYYQKALITKTKLNDSAGIASTLNNIGVLYESLKHDYDQSLNYYSKAIEIYEKIDDIPQIATLNNNIGLIYLHKGQLSKAKSHLNKAYLLREKMNDITGMASTTLVLAKLYIQGKQEYKAIELLQNADTLLKKSGNLLRIRDMYLLLSEAFANKGNYKEAYFNHSLYSEYQDSLLNETNQKNINELQTRFETEKKEKELSLLAKDNQLKTIQLQRRQIFIALLITFFLLVLAVLFLWHRQNRFKQDRMRMTIEQQLFRSQMNPHFIFNSLSAIQNFLYQADKKEVSEYISRFARLMRKILENSNKEFVPLSDEIQIWIDYMEFQKLRFPDLFEYSIHTNPELEADFILIPPMMVQPFIENAVEHGLRPLKRYGKLEINLLDYDTYLQIEISDNGIGFSASQQLKPRKQKHESMALKIVNDRLKVFSRKYHKGFTLQIMKNEESQGTKVNITVPVEILK